MTARRKHNNKKPGKGIFSALKLVMQKNRLGELMVLDGIITTGELRHALALQRAGAGRLGRVLVAERMVSRRDLYRVLAGQWALRSLAVVSAAFLVFSSVGAKTARAGSIGDLPPGVNLVQADSAFSHVRNFPALFGSSERRSGNLDAFVKWTGMFSRFESAIGKPGAGGVIAAWKNRIRPFAGLPLERMAAGVNEVVNSQDYIVDERNWGQSDYWETPVEFFQRGGDCEDFAIAKYASLRALGVPEDRLRIAIVHDEEKNLPHAILIVYADTGALVLDNQVKDVRYASTVNRYRPIFTINRTAWWLHTRPAGTLMASR